MENQYHETANINYLNILNYLKNYDGLTYSDPDKASTSEERAYFLKINQKGMAAVAALNEIVAQCHEKFGIDGPRIPWLKADSNGAGTKTKRNLLIQMKYPDRKDNPISISITVEMKNQTDVACRIRLDINEENADESTIKQYHSHLDLPLKQDDGMIYEVCDSETHKCRTTTEPRAQLRGDLKSGKLMVKIVRDIDLQPDCFEQPILAAVEAILPYYNYVLKEEDSTPNGNKNLILYGPPGTGKTYHTAIYAVAVCEGKPVEAVQEEDYPAVMDRYEALKKANRIEFTTFHQSYGYEEFIEGIKPVVGEAASDLKYTIEHGVFKRFCDAARGRAEPYVFIVDEINRGNISKIFGELITLIEDTKREGMKEQASAALPYSKKNFSVPANVYLLGTMNTADRSLALMDTALRRRFQFVEMMPDADVLRTIHADKVADLDVAEMLETINKRIALLYDREHTIGHAFFTKLAGKPTIETLQGIFKNSVIPLLQEYFYEDYQKIQLVLGDNGKTDPSTKFIVDEEVRVKDVFKGNADDMADLPEIAYSINQEAFSNLESYKQIM